MSLWEEVKTNLFDLYNVTSDKTVEVARISSKKYEKFGISRDVERQFSELGNLVYSSIQDGKGDEISTSEDVLALVERISVLEKELKIKDEEINNIRKSAPRPRAKAAASGSPDGFGNATEDETTADGPVETIITDPILQEGTEDSAILMDAGSGDEKNNNFEADGVEAEIETDENIEESPRNEG